MKTGDYLGELTDELEGYGSVSVIQKFVSGGPQNCVFGILPLYRKSCNKMQSERYNFEVWEMQGCKPHCFEEYDSGGRPPMHVHKPKEIIKENRLV